VTNDAHDMGLMPLLIDGVAHGLTVDGETFILLPIDFIPALQGAVQIDGIDADKDIADDIRTGDEVAPFFTTAVETLPALGPGFGPNRRWPVPPHSTQNGSGGNGQDRTKGVTSSLATAGSGMSRKKRGKDSICWALSMILCPPVR